MSSSNLNKKVLLLNQSYQPLMTVGAKRAIILSFSDNKIVNHVAICIGNEEIIHSSGCVKIEKLKENKELYKKLYKIMSIQNIINE